MTRRSRRHESGASHTVPIVVAAIGALGVVVAALITASGGGRDDGDGGSVGSSVAHVSVTATSLADAEPPPAVRLTVEGEATGLGGDQRVFVLGHFVAAQDATPAGSQEASTSPGEQYAVSPPAEHLPDGRWRVTWRLAERPADLTFTAVAADVIVLQGAQDGGPSVAPAHPDALRQRGPDAAASPGDAFAVPPGP